MSSEPQSLPSPQDLEPRSRVLSLFLPLLLAASAQPQSPTTVVINPSTGSLIVISGSANPDHQTKDGPPPASEAAIKALPVVKIEEKGLECSICLEEYEIGAEAKEMTCKHKFHERCIEKWLRVNGSCPVCRCRMPVEEEVVENRKEGDEVEGERREMRIRFVDGEMVIDEVTR